MAKCKYYAVVIGRVVGIYDDWESCERQVEGFPYAEYKGFEDPESCMQWFLEHRQKRNPSLPQRAAGARPATKSYMVIAGRHPGQYDTWTECKEQVDGFSGAEYISFKHNDNLQASFLDDVLQPDERYPFNRPLDLPRGLQTGITELFGVSSLDEVDAQKCAELRNGHIDFDYCKRTDYRQREENYLLTYLPAHYYKCWQPLSYALENHLLANHLRVLEIGAGPGTTTLALIDFYNRLARENRDTKFVIQYDLIEAQPGFIKIFKFLYERIQQDLALNLHLYVRCQQGEFVDLLPTLPDAAYDLFIESNVLNASEGLKNADAALVTSQAQRALVPGGLAMLVEPRQYKSRFKTDIWSYFDETECWDTLLAPEVAEVDDSGISMQDAICALGLRSQKVRSHAFVSAIYMKKEEGQS